MVNVACIQMVSTTNPEENFSRAKRLIESEAVARDCELLVLPENFLYFGLKMNESACSKVQEYIQDFQRIARQRKMNIVLGSVSVPLGDSLDRSHSRSYLINHQGALQAYYDKRHLFDVKVDDTHGQYRESATICPGDKDVVSPLTFRSGATTGLGLTICFDLRFPDQFTSMRRMGAGIIAVPSAFTAKTGKAHWEVLLRARAIETQCYVLASNQGGDHSQSRQTWGHSMIVDPWGRILSKCDMGEAVCSASLDLHLLDQVRQDMPLSGLFD